MKINEREVTVFLLVDILSNNSFNNIALRNGLKDKDLDRVQKSFVTEVVNGTLRNKIYIDYVINQYSNTKVSKMKPFIKALLRMSTYQILFMDRIPDSAVCNEAVKLAKQKNFTNLSGFVNGVLRNISRNKENIELPKKDNKTKYLSTMYSYEPWIIDYWLKQYDFDTVEQMCKFNNQSPVVTICVNTLKTTQEDLIKELNEVGVKTTETDVAGCIEIKNTSNLVENEAFKRGKFFVMDRSAQLAMNLANLKENDTVIDCCSAPGGKTFCASIYMKNTGTIISNDIYEHKIELIQKTQRRLGLTNIDAYINDASVYDEKLEQSADVVIADVPCSGLGIVRKKPDIKFNKTLKDIKDLTDIQKGILSTNSKYVKVGGTLLYCTCTISKLENEDIISDFLKENSNFELEKIEYNGEMHDTLQLIGGVNIDADSFFVAKMVRKS